MLTTDERRAVYIAAMKFGFDDFAALLNTNPQKLRRVLRGELDLQVETAIRQNWGLVKELLFGWTPKRGDKKR